MAGAEQLLPITGRLLNAVVVLIVSLSSFALWWSIIKLGLLEREQRLFAYFWLATGCLWFSSMVRNVAGAYELHDIDKLFFYGSQLFLYISGIFLAPYLVTRIFKYARAPYIAMGIYIVFGVVGFVTTLMYGIEALQSDFFSTKYVVRFPAAIFPVAIMVPMIILSIVETVYSFFRYITGSGYGHEVFAVLSIVLYVSIGAVDQVGLVVGWNLIVLRLFYVAIFLLAYGAVVRERESHGAGKGEQILYVS